MYATALVALAVIATAALVAPMIFMRTPYATDQGRPIIQPVAFDHRHHVRDDGIDCLYCHPDAERAPSAGLPSTELCMGCHGQVWPDSPLLAQVRASWETGKAIPWRRVNAVPGFVYFNHGVHVRGAGVECARCHGKVQDMARVSRHAPLTMEWCLGCHRNPPNQPDQGRRITPLTTCSACHR